MLSNSLDMDAHINRDVLKNMDKYNFYKTNCYGKDDELDAFRSAYRYGFVTLFYGEKVAKTLLHKDIKEDDTKTFNAVNSMSMKLWNAKVGINAGKNILSATKGHDYDLDKVKNALSNKIVDEMKKGNMKTNNLDRRRYEDFDFETITGTNTDSSENDETIIPTQKAPEGYHYEQTPCVGSYEVSGYTRADGTEVEDYIRTCGANHLELVKDAMYEDDSDDGGSDDGGDGGDSDSDGSDDGDGDDGGTVLNGHVEKDGEPDDGGDVYTPDGDPDGDDPNGGDEPDGGADDPAMIFAKVISGIIPSILNAVLNRASQLPNGSEDKDAINRLNASTQILNNSQEIQRHSLTKLSKQAHNTKDKLRRNQLQKKYSKIKNEHYKTQILVDKINNAVKNNDYERVVKEINEYNNERNSVGTINQPMNKQYEPRESGQDNNYVLKGSVSSGSTEENSNKTESNSESNAPETPKEFDSLGKVLSGSESTAGFLKDLNKIPGVDPYTIKKTMGVYDSPTGIQIQTQYEKEIQASVEKIAKECIDGAKAAKIATEIASKIAPVLTCAVILQQVIEGYQKGGVPDAILRGLSEITITKALPVILKILLPEIQILPMAVVVTITSVLINIIKDEIFNHFKL